MLLLPIIFALKVFVPSSDIAPKLLLITFPLNVVLPVDVKIALLSLFVPVFVTVPNVVRFAVLMIPVFVTSEIEFLSALIFILPALSTLFSMIV